MMAKLFSKNQQCLLLSDLKVADSFWARGRGLIGTVSLGPDQGMLIERCNSIHTFFMSFSIHCIFLDSQMKVRKVVKNVAPYRLVWPVWGARCVVEVSQNSVICEQLSEGDQLYVEN